MPGEVEVPKGEGVLVRSPAYIKLLSGNIEVWGAEFDEISVQMEGVELLITSSIDSKLAIDGHYVKLESPIPDWWEELPETIAGKNTVFIGRVDSGKSSTVVFTINRIARSGSTVSIIDSDVGQSDLGPPGVISSKDVGKPVIHTKLLEPDFMYFIGDKTPSGHFLPMVKGLLDALNRSRSDTVLINTTGFVDGGAARALKRFKVEFLDPDIVVLIEKEEGDLNHIARTIPKDVKVLKVRSPVGDLIKSRNYRITVRRALLRRYLSGAATRKLDLREIELMNTFLMTGRVKDEYIPFLERILGVRVHWMEESPDMLIAITEGEVDRRKITMLSGLLNKEVRIGPMNVYKGLYVGLIRGRDCKGVGIIQSMDIREGWMSVLTKYEGPLDGIALGYIRFNAEGEELGSRGMNVP
ncbi:MAG: Clp1/GlmU family protein [Candidatus Korarchaeota archaeon]|nr:Clp1/GlmU family protein [Candidatus Korarchaeota archaeon]